MTLPKIAVTVAALLFITMSAEAASNILFVLDSSGSMWGKVDGKTKMSIAKSALPQLLGEVPSGTKLGLLVYGHRDKSSCEDVELLLPMGDASADSVGSALTRIKPIGKTPIALALEQASTAFPAGTEKDSNSVVLISDGIETCNGDPCAVAGKLAAANIRVKVHVVGFDISQEDRAALECIAANGNGKYFSASSPEGFTEAVSEAIETAQADPEPAPEPEPAAQPEPAPEPAKEPERTLYFEDGFAGDDLTEQWEVVNPDPNGYIVEDDSLLIVNSKIAGFAEADTPNLVKLGKELPKGDWDLEANLRVNLETGRDQVWLGLREDEANYVGARLSSYHNGMIAGMGGEIVIDVVKRANGEESKFSTLAAKGSGYVDDDLQKVIESLKTDGGVLTLSKRGRKFFASLTLNGVKDDQGKPRRVMTESLTALRLPGSASIAVGKFDNRNGDTTIYMDKLEIFSVIAE